MKIKLDENLDPHFTSLLVAEGHDADTVLDEGISGASDRGIYDVCLSTKRVLITLDLDFSNPFYFSPEKTSGIIVLRPARPSLPLSESLFLTLLFHFQLKALSSLASSSVPRRTISAPASPLSSPP